MFVRNSVAPLISVVTKHNNETILWLKLLGMLEVEPTFIADGSSVSAMPQTSSTYVHASAIDPMVQGSGGKVLFAGDLNARTGTLCDIQDQMPMDDEEDTHWPHYPPVLVPTCEPPQRAN